MKKTLTTTADDIHTLSECAFNARDNSKHVKVPLEALKHLVMDHGVLVEIAKWDLTNNNL